MSGELSSLQVVRQEVGIFNGFQVVGIQYKGENGNLAWQVDTWKMMGSPMHMYWVERGEFRAVGVHVGYDYTSSTLIQTFETVEVEAEEKAAILDALKKWESK